MYRDRITASSRPIDVQNQAIANKLDDAATMDWSGKYTLKEYNKDELGNLAYQEMYFDYLKLKRTSKCHHVQLVSKNEQFAKLHEKKPIHDALYSKEYRAIIAKQSWRDSDDKSDTDRLKWYQLAFKNWKDEAGPDVGKLKWVVRDTITNYDTTTVIDKALDKAKIKPGDAGTFKPSDDSFKALAGTDNARGVFYILGRYHKELGDLKVIKIHAWDDVGIRCMALELGH